MHQRKLKYDYFVKLNESLGHPSVYYNKGHYKDLLHDDRIKRCNETIDYENASNNFKKVNTFSDRAHQKNAFCLIYT